MSSQANDVYDLKEQPAPPAPPPDPPGDVGAGAVEVKKVSLVIPPRASRRLHKFAKVMTWLMVAVFLLGGARWAFRAGMDLRRDMWESTRSIRFEQDIGRGFDFGNRALRLC